MAFSPPTLGAEDSTYGSTYADAVRIFEWSEEGSSGLASAESSGDEPQKSASPDSDSVEKAGKLRRGTFKNLKDRKETAQTRNLTACIRYKYQRIRVSTFQDSDLTSHSLTGCVQCAPNPDDPHGICLTCLKVTKTKVAKVPCLRAKSPFALMTAVTAAKHYLPPSVTPPLQCESESSEPDFLFSCMFILGVAAFSIILSTFRRKGAFKGLVLAGNDSSRL